MQTFTAPVTGNYKLEVWGAAGGIAALAPNANEGGAKGGYSIGYKGLTSNTYLYICIGGEGGGAYDISGMENHNCPVGHLGGTGGYNGGGRGGNGWHTGITYVNAGSGGGGATHIAITNRGVLANYSNNQSEVLIVAGGGGGSWGPGNGGDGSTWQMNDGGGEIGGDGTTSPPNAGQTEMGGVFIFGQGGAGADGGEGPGQGEGRAGGGGGEGPGQGEGRAGGGGGWYGGISNGGGGSGHIGTMCTNGSMRNGVREGNGYTIITWQQLP